MKKYVAVSVILLILSIFLITTSNANFIVGMSIKANSETIKVGDEETLTLSLNEKIIAANFEITYDSSIFTLVGSETNNLSVAKKKR